jgi:hypothetical protein
VNSEKFWNPALRESPMTTSLSRAPGPFSFSPNPKRGVDNVARQITDDGISSLLNDIKGSSELHAIESD